MTRNERAHAYLLAMLPGAAGNVEADILVKYAFSLADAFDAMAIPVETPLPKIEPQADSDGWIAWAGGGGCPIPDGCDHWVMFRSGASQSMGRFEGNWLHTGAPRDIVAYNVLS